ncbi:MAG TPA: hypothetical protein DHN33_04310, partial [Eubacteriaceae bacterium]|nr:hypothetical protein [Eubacteriaceae bacterium]
MDADDYLPHRESLEKLVQKAEETKADIVAGNYYKDMDGDLVEANEHGFKDHESTRTVDFRFRAFYSVGHLAYTWGKVYRTEFLKKNNLLMKPYRYSLDKLFNVECYLCAPVYAFVKDRVYVYRYNLSSISHQYKKGFREMWIAITKEMHQTMSAMSKGFAYFDLLAFNLFFAVFFSAKQEYTASGKSVKTVYKELEAYGQDPFVKSFMIHLAKGKYVRDIESFLWKTMIRVFSVGFRLKWYKLLAFGVK